MKLESIKSSEKHHDAQLNEDEKEESKKAMNIEDEEEKAYIVNSN